MTTVAATEQELDGVVADYLEQAIDPIFEKEGLPLRHRPFQAAKEIVQNFVIEVKEGEGPAQKPGTATDFVITPWFKHVFRATSKWYETRLGQAMAPKKDTISGAVLIYGVPFRIAIPTTTTRPGKPGHGGMVETVWVRFPDTVLADENVTSWLITPPNLEAMPAATLADVQKQITDMATALRSIRTNLMAAGATGDAIGLQKGVLANLETFVELIHTQEPKCIQKAYWELQMACESAFKAVLLQRKGQFREIHDLFLLYDDLNAVRPLGVSRDLLKGLPKWKEMAELRYGLGTRESLSDCFECYRTTLAVAKAVVAEAGPGGISGLGQAEFELACPPWFQ